VPQAQDLLVELIEYSWHVVFFLALVFFVWASTTHYTARLLLDTDERFRARVAERNTDFIKGWEILLPRLLGALAFVAVFLSAERSQWCFVCDRPTYPHHRACVRLSPQGHLPRRRRHEDRRQHQGHGSADL
jgi:hypothetical protein